MDEAKFLVLQREAGARGIRTLVAGYPTNRISRTTVITVGEDGVISKTTTTKLSPGTATAGTATSAVTVTGGSAVVKKP